MSITLDGIPAIIAIFAVIAIPMSLVALIVSRTSRFTHRKSKLIGKVIIAEYDPPLDLSPAELGYLFDSRINKTELVATLVDLEQKGLIVIDHSKLHGVSISKQEAAQTSGLKDHELVLLNNLSEYSNLSVFSLKVMMRFKQSIVSSLLSQGLIKSPFERIIYYSKRTFIAYVLVTAPFFALFVFGTKESIFSRIVGTMIFFIVFFPFFLGLALIMSFIYNKIVGQPGVWTDKLKQTWPDIEGYRDYVRQVELDELKFESADLKVRSKNKAMPYAIALGLDTEWQKRFL